MGQIDSISRPVSEYGDSGSTVIGSRPVYGPMQIGRPHSAPKTLCPLTTSRTGFNAAWPANSVAACHGGMHPNTICICSVKYVNSYSTTLSKINLCRHGCPMPQQGVMGIDHDTLARSMIGARGFSPWSEGQPEGSCSATHNRSASIWFYPSMINLHKSTFLQSLFVFSQLANKNSVRGSALLFIIATWTRNL